MTKITYKDFINFLAEYFYDPKSERLGQAFINKFMPEETNVYLFHQTDNWKATEVIIEQYVEPDEDFFNRTEHLCDTDLGETDLTVNQNQVGSNPTRTANNKRNISKRRYGGGALTPGERRRYESNYLHPKGGY